MEKQEFFPVKVWCLANPNEEPRMSLYYLSYGETPDGHYCFHCLKNIERDDGVHTWDLTNQMIW